MARPAFPEIAAIRLGSGLSPRFPPPADSAAVLDDLAQTAKRTPAITTDAAAQMNRDMRDTNRAVQDGKLDRKTLIALRDHQTDLAREGFRRRLALGATAPVGFGERLVQFWSDHFTTRPARPPGFLMGMAHIDAAIRPNIAGPFNQLLRAAILHPSMIVFLDQQASFGAKSIMARQRAGKQTLGINENLARELIELHTLGVHGDYSQTDVRELAKLLTGLTYNINKGMFFDPRRAEPGAETVLGTSYGGRRSKIADIEAVLDDLAVHPSTARHIAAKLATHFVADQPPEALISAMEARFVETGGDLTSVYAVMIEHPTLVGKFRNKLRQPLDMMIAALRALDMDEPTIMAITSRDTKRLFLDPLARMGHDWGNPVGPDGLPESAESWITPQRLAERIGWAMRIVPHLRDPLPDARELLQTALHDTYSDALAWAVPRAETNAEGVGLILASADFNRR